MTTEKEQLEAEIAQRDERIAELEGLMAWQAKAIQEEREAYAMSMKDLQTSAVHLLFDGPPGPEYGRFVGAEDPTGKSINASEWSQRPDGYWQLVIQQPSAGVVDDRAAFDEWFNDFSLSVRMNGVQMNDAQMFAAWQARARLDQPTASAGVVVGALVSALEGIVHDERVPNEVSQDYAALLIEARRLNPCRAQAVPDGYVLAPVEPTGEMEQFICNCDVRNGAITGDYPEWQQCYKAMLAAAPSAQQKESSDE